MSKIGETIRSYVWWMYPRGSIHYDVMVTIILVFIFLAPLWINFRDKPVERSPHQTEVVVTPDGEGFVYKVEASAVKPGSDEDIRESLERVLTPIAGEITIDRYQAVQDSKHHVTAYQVWAHH